MKDVMTYLPLLTSIALPAALIAFVFLLPLLRKELEIWAKHASERSEIIEEYHANAMAFLKATDPSTHAELRDVVVSMGYAMMDGSKLIRLVLFSRALSPRTDEVVADSVSKGVGSLSDEALHAMAHAMGAALIVSSLNAIVLGKLYRSALMLALNSRDDRELREPAQIVYRYKKADPRWAPKPSAC